MTTAASGDDPAGFAEHHDYMWELLKGVRRVVADGEGDYEDLVVARWLETNPPDWSALEPDLDPDPDYLTIEPAALDDDHVAAACTLAARLMAWISTKPSTSTRTACVPESPSR